MDKYRRAYKDKTADRIKATLLLEKLQQHALEGADMSQSQINAANILLKKVMPDLKVVENQGGQKYEVVVNAKSAQALTTAVRSAITRS